VGVTVQDENFVHILNNSLLQLSDPIVSQNSQQKMPFWRSRIIALYVDWAKTFNAFRKMPHSDKVIVL
jgi:hypothetical protein